MVKPTVALVLSVGIAIGCGGRSDSPTPASGPAPDQPSLPATRAVPLDGGASANPAVAELAAVEKVYATCQTYRDTATVTVEYYGPSRARAEYDRKPRQVKTAFERGGAIRFEYRQPILDRGPHPRKEWVCVVWAKGEEVREWPEDRNPIIKQFGKDPQRVLAVLTGVTQGTSTKIPAMLLPRVARELKPEVGFTPGRGGEAAGTPWLRGRVPRCRAAGRRRDRGHEVLCPSARDGGAQLRRPLKVPSHHHVLDRRERPPDPPRRD